jgi:hypothetical protein
MSNKEDDKLLVITRIKKTIIYLDGVVENFPNKELVLKDSLKSTIFNLLEIAYMANVSTDNDRLECQRNLLVKMKMLDFYIKISFDKKYISYKRYGQIGNHLLEITKLIQGWIKSEEG